MQIIHLLIRLWYKMEILLLTKLWTVRVDYLPIIFPNTVTQFIPINTKNTANNLHGTRHWADILKEQLDDARTAP